MKYLFIFLVFGFVFYSCEKEITVDLPQAKDKIVIEGSIENDMFPIVIISRNMSYFDKVDADTYEQLIVDDAIVTVTCEGVTDTLFFINPFYTNFTVIGEIGKKYDLKVEVEGKVITGTTIIPNAIPVDSIKFFPSKVEGRDSLGFLWFYAMDPDTLGNCYRIFTKTEGKDPFFVHPAGSATNDQFFNGQLIEFSVESGDNPYIEEPETNPDSVAPSYYFMIGDTVTIKLSSITSDHYMFWYTIEQQMGTDGNPFASPTTVRSNLKGDALGVWGGYGSIPKTFIITEDMIMEDKK
ncbi:MAG: DUF4249 domain-containing protein [Bacteroidales bacterium]|nr:DUF4249 domain-containing protein [Bacteroidales bacterium]